MVDVMQDFDIDEIEAARDALGSEAAYWGWLRRILDNTERRIRHNAGFLHEGCEVAGVRVTIRGGDVGIMLVDEEGERDGTV